ncbi:LON peptidase substrate-binding domain-containing protein [Viridibacterium curvum]|uniref:LON peptidase substrate-binding domain-containing protein n=1 Tax=Viridibacterium curvum TaxID=1101404 RepID=A0ABP9QQJ6_9RHOO
MTSKPAAPGVSTAPAASQLPIFPLGNVLHPEGRMKLRIFEARYMDMIGECMRNDAAFGICLIDQGREVGEAATPHAVGVEAHIIDWDMTQPGVLHITVRGGRRFRIRSHQITQRQTVAAEVDWLMQETASVAPKFVSMQSLLRLIAADKGRDVIAEPHAFDEANWLAFRFAEILPIPPLARLKLLELDDADMRLTIIHQYLMEHGLIK